MIGCLCKLQQDPAQWVGPEQIFASYDASFPLPILCCLVTLIVDERNRLAHLSSLQCHSRAHYSCRSLFMTGIARGSPCFIRARGPAKHDAGPARAGAWLGRRLRFVRRLERQEQLYRLFRFQSPQSGLLTIRLHQWQIDYRKGHSRILKHRRTGHKLAKSVPMMLIQRQFGLSFCAFPFYQVVQFM